tara:strand:+ start:854 stop:1024 length:171 start_codon:yes stop_codon:yes gene_type:complete
MEGQRCSFLTEFLLLFIFFLFFAREVQKERRERGGRTHIKERRERGGRVHGGERGD